VVGGRPWQESHQETTESREQALLSCAIVGQMFLNMLVKATDEDALADALRAGLPAPATEGECRQKFADFLAFVEEARERARSIDVSPPPSRLRPYSSPSSGRCGTGAPG
jgi:hypothetical protein